MKEAEWQACGEPELMLNFLRDKVSERKFRLFSVACCRRIWNLIPDKTCRRAVDVAERYSDGLATEEERHWAHEDAMCCNAVTPDVGEYSWAAIWAADGADYFDADRSYDFVGSAIATASSAAQVSPCASQLILLQTKLLRCILGNPFRPVTVDPAWLSPTVVSLATAIYEERAFDRLPILADALEDAGCTSADLLKHCREPGEHARGCWAVDLVLGKQ